MGPVDVSIKRMLLMALLSLTACTTGPRPDGSSEPVRPSVAASHVGSHWPASPQPTRTVGMPRDHDCGDAFAAIPGEMARLPRLDDGGAALEPTLEACSTLDAWLDVADAYFTEMQVSRGEAEAFIADRCSVAPELDDAALCSALD